VLLQKQNRYRHILAFGSNRGDRQKNCEIALEKLQDFSVVLRKSKTLVTKAITLDKNPQEYYLNFIVEVASDYSSYDFYKKIVVIEDFLGHSRVSKWAPREIDIDILFSAVNSAKKFYDCKQITVEKENFTVPHKEIAKRTFLLELLEQDFPCVMRGLAR
jgi:2-amino-4-hydroxy-6-hydroxymethyldihydropteridine diphosphokinase